MSKGPLDSLIRNLAGLPGLGPRSARRIALHLLTEKDKNLKPLIESLAQADENITKCTSCGNLDFVDPCHICTNQNRDHTSICVIAGVSDLWAIERTGAYKGLYHVLGGVLSAMDGIGPKDLNIESLIARMQTQPPAEIILALSATVDGQATAHYLMDKLAGHTEARITRLAHGVPVGGELGYLDDGTITTALKSRAAL